MAPIRQQARLVCAALGLVCGCSNLPTDHASVPSAQEEAATDHHNQKKLTREDEFGQFKASARTTVAGQEVFVVEQDMVFDNEAALLEYWRSTVSPREDAKPNPNGNKSIVNLVGGARDVRVDSVPATQVIDIRWCFDGSNWGGTEAGDTDGDSVFNEALPTKASVRDALQAGMGAWEGQTNVRFTYLSSQDGAGCAGAADFAVTLDTTSNCFAQGPFPSRAVQQLKVPICGLPQFLPHHELGHVLGLRHEHIHTNSTVLGCPEDANNDGVNDVNGVAFEELTAFDLQSTMIYASPCANGLIGNNPVSSSDGVGVRRLYGPPQWWWGVLI